MRSRTVKSPAILEILENRCLLAYAPTSIAGWIFDCRIAHGTDPFAPSGSFQLRVGVSSHTYLIVGRGDVASSSGTYTFSRTGSNTASVRLDDDLLGSVFAQDLVFRSRTAGNYTAVGGGGSQDGTFIATPAVSAAAAIRGSVFFDHDSDGVRDSHDGGLSRRRVFLDKDNDGIFDSGEKSKLTDPSGAFAFESLTPGRYRLREVAPTGWKITRPSSGVFTIDLADSQVVEARRFGNSQVQTRALAFQPPKTRFAGNSTVRQLDVGLDISAEADRLAFIGC